MYTGNQLRQMFLDFFASKGHTIVPSASLIPRDDPTLLLTVAGMVPFKPYFLRKVEPPYLRATTSQKCVRTPDLEAVGRTARHHTFFEMLGNFSFGDYFKEGAITWAWEFITEVLRVPLDKLWVSVFPGDDEAMEIWASKAGIVKDRIVLDESNFWAAGPTGPCGPCSEIYVDLGVERSCGPECKMGCDCDRFLEIWNLVFMQYNRDEAGNLTPLPNQNIDTGMGLERIAAVMQGVESNFDTDLLRPIIDRTAEIAGITYKQDPKLDVSLKVIADHLRAVTFMLGDGVRPDNDGRGYVLRRILRRAVRHGRLLGIKEAFADKVVDVITADYGQAYPELIDNHNFIINHLLLEERKFLETLDQGMNIMGQFTAGLQSGACLSGQDTFELYATYGFPLELTEEILAEQGINVDREGFMLAMDNHRELAKQSFNREGNTDENHAVLEELAKKLGPSTFVGYDGLETETKVLALIVEGGEVETAVTGQTVRVVLERTPFYAESGGQSGDNGILKLPEGEVDIDDTCKISDTLIVHIGRVSAGEIKRGQLVRASVKAEDRTAVSRNHSATHLLHKALKQVLGMHVNQAGSLVNPGRLRFDFSHFAAVTTEQLNKIEFIVNQVIMANIKVESIETSIDAARATGAAALFGEKYGEVVRMVSIGDFSIELCGGTHINSSGELGLFRILSEGGIGSGLRRIEAACGQNALTMAKEDAELIDTLALGLKTPRAQVLERVEALVSTLKEREREIQILQQKLAQNQIGELLEKVEVVQGVRVLAAEVQAPDADALRVMVDLLRDKLGSGVIVLGSSDGEKVQFVSAVSKDLIGKLHAGNIVKEVAKIAGGGGGGRPDMAQAGGKDPGKLEQALKHAIATVNYCLK